MKEKVIEHIKNDLQKRMNSYASSMLDIQNSVNNETKSSAGDKYETGRSMSQMELSMQQAQYKKVEYDFVMMEQIEKKKSGNSIETGSLVKTNSGYYFIAISFGKINVGNTDIVVLSPLTPLAKTLLNKRVGDTAIFNQQQLLIQKIW